MLFNHFTRFKVINALRFKRVTGSGKGDFNEKNGH